MAQDGVMPPGAPAPKNERCVCTVSGRAPSIDRWVAALSERSGTRLDWHNRKGGAKVVHFGDEESRQRVRAAIRELQSQFDGTILDLDPK